MWLLSQYQFFAVVVGELLSGGLFVGTLFSEDQLLLEAAFVFLGGSAQTAAIFFVLAGESQLFSRLGYGKAELPKCWLLELLLMISM